MAFLKLRFLRPLALVLSLVMVFCLGIVASHHVKRDVYFEHIVPVANNFAQVKQTRDPDLAKKQINFAYNGYAKRYFSTHVFAVLAANNILPLESPRVLRHSLNTLPPIERSELVLILVQDLRDGEVSEPVFRKLYQLDNDQFNAAQQCYDEVYPETSDVAEAEMALTSSKDRIKNRKGACWTFFDLMPLEA